MKSLKATMEYIKIRSQGKQEKNRINDYMFTVENNVCMHFILCIIMKRTANPIHVLHMHLDVHRP